MKFDILKPETVAGVGSNGSDAICVFPSVGDATIHDKLFVVAEGDGSGSEAAKVFAQTFSDQMFQNTCADEPLAEDVFKEALFSAKDKLDEECRNSNGTQYAMVYLHRHGVLAAHVGAVRIYHVRPKGRRLLYKSKDNESVLVPGTQPMSEPSKAYITNVKYGDYFVIMSKAACQAISDRVLMDVMCEPVNDKTKSVRLKKLAEAEESDFAVSVIHISGVMNEAMDESLFENESKLMAAMLADIEKEKRTAVAANTNEKDHKSSTAAERTGKKEPEVEEEDYPDSQMEERPKREFPIVTVTALALVLLAIGIWFWAQRPNDDNAQEEVVNTKKTNEKDTINILKNTRPKAVVDDTNTKDEKKKEEEKEKEKKETASSQEKRDERNVGDSNTPATTTGTPATPGQETSPSQPATTTPPASTTPPATTTPTAPATPPPADTPPSDGTVKPKPVIPDGEGV